MSPVPSFAVAWDVDGTLVDSEPLHLQSLRRVCDAFSVDIDDFGAQPFVGVAIDEVWRLIGARFGPALGRDETGRHAAFRAAVAEHYLAGVDLLRPMPGALEALAHFEALGVPMCAVSNSDAAVVAANLSALDARELMRFAVTLDDVRRPKPDPEPYRLAAARLGLPAGAVLAIEDSLTGCESAFAAGLAVVQVGTDLTAAGDADPRWPRLQRPDQLIGRWPPRPTPGDSP